MEHFGRAMLRTLFQTLLSPRPLGSKTLRVQDPHHEGPRDWTLLWRYRTLLWRDPGVLGDILSGIFSGILSGNVSSNLSDTLFGILSGISSCSILSGNLLGILSGILSDKLSG